MQERHLNVYGPEKLYERANQIEANTIYSPEATICATCPNQLIVPLPRVFPTQ